MLGPEFFDREACAVARALLGKVIRSRHEGLWLSARIIEVEAYEIEEKGSHASLGRSPSREALFMPPGTIYMYYARGGDSLNVSVRGEGSAVLIKGAYPHFDARSPEATALPRMQALSPSPRAGEVRPKERILKGQTLLCRALALRVPDWDRRPFDRRRLYIEDAGLPVGRVVAARRLGIPEGRDEHLLYRFLEEAYAPRCTENPLTKRAWREGREWKYLG